MPRASKRTPKPQTRTAAEFDLMKLAALLAMPRTSANVYSWSLADIFTARDDQLRGKFKLPARLAEAMLTDDALFTAYSARLAPAKAIKVDMEPASTKAKALSVADEAEGLYGQGGPGLSLETTLSILGCLVTHGVAIAYLEPKTREDGSRVDFFAKCWPIEHVYWSEAERCYMTRIKGDPDEKIVHGNGRWIVFQGHELDAFKHDACLLPAAIVWPTHAYARRDWSKGSVAHGSAKVVGEMPSGMPIQADGADTLTPEAAALYEALRAIATGDSPIALRPSGSKIDFMVNSSTAWQVWLELVKSASVAAARIYLGTDGILGAQGGAPGVDLSILFGVASTKLQGDFEVLTRGFQTGLVDVWTAVNFGDSSLAPKRVYLLPDPDKAAKLKEDKERRAELHARRKAFFEDIDLARKNGFVIDQEHVDALAEEYEVEPPKLAPSVATAPAIQLSALNPAVVTRVNEARAATGRGPLTLPDGSPDPDGEMMVAAYEAKLMAAPPAAA